MKEYIVSVITGGKFFDIDVSAKNEKEAVQKVKSKILNETVDWQFSTFEIDKIKEVRK